jgi:lipopolysaccharide transport system permease protein
MNHYWDLLFVLTRKDLKVRYNNNVLGYAWSIANPLAFALVFYIAFKVFMRIQMEDYALFLIVGLFPWQWFANSIGMAPTTFLNNGSIIKKINFPRSVVVLSIVLQDMVHFALSLPVIAGFLLVYGKPITWSWLYGIPVLLPIHFCLTYGLALFIATVNLFFRDMENLTRILVQILFFLTPVMYSLDMIPAQYRDMVSLNPMASLMVNWRNVLLRGHLDLEYLATSVVYALIALLIGHVVYRSLSWRFAEVL